MIQQWKVWVPEYGSTEDDARYVGGLTARDAAEQNAERLCRSDPDYYAIFLGDGLVMHVREVLPMCQGGVRRDTEEYGDDVHVLRVSGRQRIDFSAAKEKP